MADIDDLAEAKRHIEPAPNLAASVVPERYLMAAPPFTPTPDPCAHLRAELTRLKSSQAEHDRTVRLEALNSDDHWDVVRTAYIEGLRGGIQCMDPEAPTDDLDEAGYDYVANLRAQTGQESGT